MLVWIIGLVGCLLTSCGNSALSGHSKVATGTAHVSCFTATVSDPCPDPIFALVATINRPEQVILQMYTNLEYSLFSQRIVNAVLRPVPEERALEMEWQTAYPTSKIQDEVRMDFQALPGIEEITSCGQVAPIRCSADDR